MASASRPAEPGELCPCGRPAVVVQFGGRFGDTGDCEPEDGGARVDGVCVFCGDTVDHAHYAAAERAVGRESAPSDPRVRQGGRCPLYRLRLADPLPPVHAESVRAFDLAAWRREQTRRRLIAEVAELLLAAGVQDDPTEAAVAGEITVDQLPDVAAAAGADPDGRAVPVFLLASLLADLDHAGVTGSPAHGLTLDTVVAGAAGWDRAGPLQRARLVVTRVRDELDAADLLYAIPRVTADGG